MWWMIIAFLISKVCLSSNMETEPVHNIPNEMSPHLEQEGSRNPLPWSTICLPACGSWMVTFTDLQIRSHVPMAINDLQSHFKKNTDFFSTKAFFSAQLTSLLTYCSHLTLYQQQTWTYYTWDPPYPNNYLRLWAVRSTVQILVLPH